MASRKAAHVEENGKLEGMAGCIPALQCGSGDSTRLQELPSPDGEHSVAAAAPSLHQQVCHSTGTQQGGQRAGKEREREPRKM